MSVVRRIVATGWTRKNAGNMGNVVKSRFNIQTAQMPELV